MKKIVIALLVVGLLSATAVWYYIFVYSVHHRRSAEAEKSIQVTAEEIVSQYQSSESIGNAKYLNKAVKVTGVVKETGKDQKGNLTITLKSEDDLTSVFCTLKPTESVYVSVGSTVSILGFCNGFLSDVVVNECTVVK